MDACLSSSSNGLFSLPSDTGITAPSRQRSTLSSWPASASGYAATSASSAVWSWPSCARTTVPPASSASPTIKQTFVIMRATRGRGSGVRPVPLAEPGAVVRHLGALCRRRVALAGRRLVALVGGAPAQLDAVVEVIAHFEIGGAVDHVLQRKRPRRAVAARIGELARRKLRRQHALQFGLHLGDALAARHGVALGLPRHLVRTAAHHVDGDEQTEVPRRRGEILPGAIGREDRRAVRHGRFA